MFRIGQAVSMAAVALGVRSASPVPRHFSVALNYHLDSQLKNPNLPWDFAELINNQQQKRRFTSEAVNANDNHGEDKKETRVSSISITIVDEDGEEKITQMLVGMSMLEAAHQNDIELEGACEGSVACSTCHVIVMRVGINYYYLSHRAFSLSSGKVISKEEKGGQDAFMRSLNEKMNQVSLGKLACKDKELRSVGKKTSDPLSAKLNGAVSGNDTTLLSRSKQKMVHNKNVYKLIEQYDQLLVCSADNVGPHQLQSIRQQLRPNSVVFLGKNATMKTAIQAFAEKSGITVYQNIKPLLVGNVALIFTKGGLIDAVVPPGNTVLELMKKGEKASSSEADLLAKLGILALSHGLVVKAMYGNGSVFDPAILDIVEEELKEKFSAVFSLWQPFLSLSTILH